ncbi:hypothetical protein [Nitratifractor sp.]
MPAALKSRGVQIALGVCLLGVWLSAADFEATRGYDIRSKTLHHPSAMIPEMCYTRTQDPSGKAHNPCYACHTRGIAPNDIHDEVLQASYDFPAPALRNPYRNDFLDFRPAIAAIDDRTIRNYVNQSNYFDANGSIILARKLRNLPPEWDGNGDGRWEGYIPDCYYRFDKQGLDRRPDGSYTGWTAFAYMPFLGTFWPANGSTDDVLIRLPGYFARRVGDGEFNATVYRTNLAILQALIQRRDVPIEPTDEQSLGVDLDKDGRLGVARKIRYDWAPLRGHTMSYVGEAARLLQKGKVHLAAGLYPVGTEFLHSVRYIRSDRPGQIALAPRMKELRYARKRFWLNYAVLHNKTQKERMEADFSPDRLETFDGDLEHGLVTGTGWVYQGFIEDRFGALRPQSYEETLYCMGCHAGIGATTDTTFAFPRKLDGYRHGWYHWSQKDLRQTPERRYHDGTWELTQYLKLNHSGDEFRENDEVLRRFFDADGMLNKAEIEALHRDVTRLLYPSHRRAVMLNKAYRALVQTQRFYDGRSGHAAPLKHIWRELNASQPTGNEIYRVPR